MYLAKAFGLNDMALADIQQFNSVKTIHCFIIIYLFIYLCLFSREGNSFIPQLQKQTSKQGFENTNKLRNTKRITSKNTRPTQDITRKRTSNTPWNINTEMC